MVTQFCSLSDEVPNSVYELLFVRLMHEFLRLLQEAMIDARDVRETNELYSLLFDDICRMSDHLSALLDINECEDTHEELQNAEFTEDF